MNSDPVLLFVYGTLMRGEENEAQMEGATFRGVAETEAGWTLYQLDGYPGLAASDGAAGVEGEVWSVHGAHLQRLDDFEGVAEGLYVREAIRLCGEWSERVVFTYRHGQNGVGRTAIGRSWRRTDPEASPDL